MGVLKYRDPETREWKVAGAYPTPAYTEPDAYTRAETLSDDTKAAYGLGADAVPNAVFEKLVAHGSIVQEFPASTDIEAGDVCDVVNGEAGSTIEYITHSGPNRVSGINMEDYTIALTKSVVLDDNKLFL